MAVPAAGGLLVWIAWAGYNAGRDDVDRLFEEECVAFQAERCMALFEAGGLPFRSRPAIRVSTRRELQLALAEEIIPELERNASFAPRERSRVARECADPIARNCNGVCLRGDTILLIPDNFRDFARRHPECLTEGHVRLLLLHELSHASDYARFGLDARRDEMKENPDVWCALIEGHAEFVTRRLAARAGLTPEFAQREEAYAGAFEYVTARRFFEALEAAGIDERVAFATPPASAHDIVDSTRYLAALAASRGAAR